MNRRSPIVVVASAAGLAGVLGLHVGAPASILSVASTGGSSAGQQAAGAAGGSNPPAGSSGASSTASASANKSGSTAGGAVPPALAIQRTAVGASEQYGYGVLSVSVTVNGTRITNVSVSQLQTAEQYSQQLATQVIPMLRSEVLSAQSARINGISGASYTSEAYALSVQSALDKLHA